MPYWRYCCNSGRADISGSLNHGVRVVCISELGPAHFLIKASRIYIFNWLLTHCPSSYTYPLFFFWQASLSSRLISIIQPSKLWRLGSGSALSYMHIPRSCLSFDPKAPIIPHSLPHSGSFIPALYTLPSQFSGGSPHFASVVTKPGSALVT